MRNIAAIVLTAFLLASCSSGATGGGLPVPLKAVGSASGDMAGPQVFLAGIPMNALVKIHGDVTYTVQPMAPFVTLDGDWTIIVEPLPGQEPAAQQAVEQGHMLIRRGGQPGGLNAPGSIRAFKAATAELKSYRVEPPSTFPPAR